MALRIAGGGRFRHRIKPVRSTPFRGCRGYRRDPGRRRGNLGCAVASRGVPRRLRDDAKALSCTVPRDGKTLLARAVAGEAGVRFFRIGRSCRDLCGPGSSGFVPCSPQPASGARVIYIDESTPWAVGARPCGKCEREQTLDQLLSEIDGFRTDPAKPIVVLASTNRLDDLDPALVRSGFRCKIAVGLPDRRARREILDVHLRKRRWPPEPTRPVAAMTAGLAVPTLGAVQRSQLRAAVPVQPRSNSRTSGRRSAACGGPSGAAACSRTKSAGWSRTRDGARLVGHMSPTCDPVERVTVIPQGHALGVTIALPTEDRFLATRTECMERDAHADGRRAARNGCS